MKTKKKEKGKKERKRKKLLQLIILKDVKSFIQLCNLLKILERASQLDVGIDIPRIFKQRPWKH